MAREQLDPAEIDALIHELETKISRLRAIYEQYFMGIERMPPHTLRKDVVRLIYQMETLYIRNTATKFKVRSLIQRFNSYKAYWSRVERQIEEGTYSRDIRRAERNRERRRDRSERNQEAAAERRADDGVVEIDFNDVVDLRDLEIELQALDQEGAFDRRPNEPQPPEPQQRGPVTEERRRQKLAEIAGALGIEKPVTQQPAPKVQHDKPKPARGPAVSIGARREKLTEIKRRMEQRSASSNSGGDDDARRVYNQLVEAKKRCNEPTDKLSYESVAKSMQKQRDKIKQTRGGDVDFKVVVKDGRAFIKPETK